MNLDDIPGLKLPPHNIEFEQAILGCLLKQPERMDDIGLGERDFYDNAHRLIFMAIRDCLEADGKCDVIIAAERLKLTGNLESAGGLPYLVSLMQNTPGAANLRSYVKGIADKSLERGLLTASYEIGEIAASSEPYAEKLAKSQALLMGIETAQASSEAVSLRDAMKAMIERVDRAFHGTEQVTKTHFHDLDEKIIGLGAGDMVVLAGRPSMGKTAFALQIATQVSETLPVLIFSLEMGAEQLAMRQAATEGKIDLMALRSGKLEGDDWDKLSYVMGKLSSRPFFIDDRSSLSMQQIRARARQTKRKHGLGLIVIDYIGLIDGPGDNRVNVVSDISRSIKGMARELGVPVIALSQLNRQIEQRQNKRPLMSDLRDSGSIEQDADLILMLYRDEYYNPDTEWKGVAECIIAKQRNGPTGMIPLAFKAEHARFGNFAGRYDPDKPKESARRGFGA